MNEGNHHSAQLNMTADIQADVWERWGWAWSAIFYVTLIGPAILALLDAGTGADQALWVVALSVLSGFWHWLGAIKLLQRLPDFRQRPFLMWLYLIVTVALWYLLVNVHPAFYFLLFSLYGQVFAFLPIRWAIPGSVLLSALVAYQQAQALSWRNPTVWLFILMSVVGVFFALWINDIIRQSSRRRELIEQLQSTQRQLVRAERKAGVLAERQRLAHEIHDTLAQGFTSIVMHLEAAEQALPGGAAAVQEHIDQARRTARESLEQARRVVHDLRPQSLENASLPEAIGRVVNRWSEATNITADVTTTGDIQPLHPDVEVTLLRAAQEALANARKHASASTVRVTLSYIGDVVMLDVQDNGVGLDGTTATTAGSGSGFGLVAMRQRVEQLGGALLIESAPGEGTTLVVEIPVAEPARTEVSGT